MTTTTLSVAIRIVLATFISISLARHGLKRQSLNISGAVAAVVVGFISFAVSYRFGVILILFYYSSSKFTKLKENVKAKLEDGYAVGGQRNWVQVLANSVIATALAAIYWFSCGDDAHVDFRDHNDIGPMIWILYISHYACANADTWASEIGILSTSKPRLVTSLWCREVPPGTNGGMSLLGTAASAAGGAFIGFVFWFMSFFAISSSLSSPSNLSRDNAQWPMIVVGLVAGVLGSLIDSLLGATIQATYYSPSRQCIVKPTHQQKKDNSNNNNSNNNNTGLNDVVIINGMDVLTNEEVNFYSIALTCMIMIWVGPRIFCLLDASQCI